MFPLRLLTHGVMYLASLTTLAYFSVDNNPHLLCTADSCVNNGENGHTKKSTVVPVVASIASLAVLIVAIVMFLVLRKKKASKVEGINH